MNSIAILAHVIWATPMNIVGLMVFPGSKRVRDSSIARFYLAGPIGQWFFEKSGMAAITLGFFIFTRHPVVSERIAKHETRHVWQQLILGPLFPFAYYLPMLWLLVAGKNPYWSTPLEIDARKAEALP